MSDGNTLTLDEFIKEREAEIAKFKAEWLRCHAVNPEHFPVDLPPGVWDEALLLFDGNQLDVSQPDGPEC